jgi:hypothetical protein
MDMDTAYGMEVKYISSIASLKFGSYVCIVISPERPGKSDGHNQIATTDETALRWKYRLHPSYFLAFSLVCGSSLKTNNVREKCDATLSRSIKWFIFQQIMK